ncbi:unnamed protein product [Urochloa humidicola]
MEARREREEEEDCYGSASPKSLLGRRAGICEGDGSSPSPPRVYCALAPAAGGHSYMRMMQAAAMGMPPPPPPPQVVVVEPRAAGIKQQAQAGGEHGNKLFTFLGFVVAPRPGSACCSTSRDHPFEVVGSTSTSATTANRLPPCHPAPPHDEQGCSLSLSLALDTSGEEGSLLSSSSSSSGSRISLDLSLSTLE